MRNRHIITLTLIIIWTICSQARMLYDRITSSTLRREQGFLFLDRMLLSSGLVSINIHMNLETQNNPTEGAYQMIFAAIPDDSWDHYLKYKCKMSLQTPQIPTQGDRRYSKNIVIDSKTLKATQSINFTINKQTSYHFILTDCKRNLVNQYFNKKSKLYYQITITNNDSNVAADEKKLGWLIPLFITINALLIYVLANKNSFSEHNETDYPKILIQVALYSRLVSLIFILIEFLIYSLGVGYEYGFFQFMYLFFCDLCDVLVLFVFSFMAYGWNTRYKEHRDQEIYFPLAAMGGFMSIIITMVTKINDGSIEKYHMHDTIPTFILMILKFVIFIIFLIGIIRSLSKKTTNISLMRFFKLLGVVGTLYHLQLFIIFLLANYYERCERETWVLLAFEWSRTLVLVLITWSMYSKKSLYRKVSLINKSFMENDNKYL